MSGSYACMNEAGLCRTVLLKEGGLKVGSCLTLGNELPEKTHVLTKQEILLGKGRPGGEQRGEGTQENSSWLLW